VPFRGVSTYASMHARVRIMYSLLLTPHVLANLREAPDLNAFLELLKDTAYGPYLQKYESKDLGPRKAVYQIKNKISAAYRAVIRMAPSHIRPLLDQLYRHFELDNLKAILRGIVTGSSWEKVSLVLFPMDSTTVLPAQAMVESGSVEEAIELLIHTPYYDTLSHAMSRYSKEQTLFPLEVAMDISYWRKLWEFATRITRQERVYSLRMIGSLMDMNNLMWAIRYRVYHHLSEEEIINYTLPFGYHLRDEDIREIAAGADLARVLGRIHPSLRQNENLLQQPEDRLPELEITLQRLIKEQCETVFWGYPFHIGLPLAYLILSEQEVHDLTVLIEAKSSKMPFERFAPSLISTPAQEGQSHP
jgi:V/A-type H+-transporting ATPase subunit C